MRWRKIDRVTEIPHLRSAISPNQRRPARKVKAVQKVKEDLRVMALHRNLTGLQRRKDQAGQVRVQSGQPHRKGTLERERLEVALVRRQSEEKKLRRVIREAIETRGQRKETTLALKHGCMKISGPRPQQEQEQTAQLENRICKQRLLESMELLGSRNL